MRIASRGSELALWQAHAVRDALLEREPGLEVRIEVVRTTGDRVLDVPLARIGDRGLFTKEIDSALLDGSADLAVHSLKDLPTRVPDGLCLAAVTEREDPRDVLLCRPGLDGAGLDTLPAGSVVGTSSLRRRAQLRARRPDVEVVDLRGNLNTRRRRLEAGEYDAIVLAAAGVIRLGWADRISARLDPAEWLPAVGQGALALVTRSDDAATRARARALHHPPTGRCCAAERAFLHALEGGCQVPIGALADVAGDGLRLHGLVAALDGESVIRGVHSSEGGSPEAVGEALAASLLARGADAILAAVRAAEPFRPAPPP